MSKDILSPQNQHLWAALPPQDRSDVAHHVVEMEGIRQQGEAPEETNRADLAISCDSRKAKHRHVVQFPLGMNLLRDLIDLEMLWLGIKQNEIGVEMKRGRECSAAVILLPNDVLAACLQCRTNERSQTRLVIDKENALASSHQDQPRSIL